MVRELESGALDLQHLQELLRGRRRDACNVVSVSHIPTSSGRVYDAEALGAVLRLSPGTPPPPIPCSRHQGSGSSQTWPEIAAAELLHGTSGGCRRTCPRCFIPLYLLSTTAHVY